MAGRRKINVRHLLIFLGVVAAILFVIILLISKIAGRNSQQIESPAAVSSTAAAETETADPIPRGEGNTAFTDTNSLLLLANKKHALPDGYVPADLRTVNVVSNVGEVQMRDEAATALETMFAAAAEDGITLVAQTAYRSADFQAVLYNGYVADYGTEEADRISSRPGYSDHQTGLAMDISDHDAATVFTEEMKNTPEGQWLYEHAHEYGFIERYPEGKEEITGYSFEPWHYRYVGVEYATAIYNTDPDETFEEFFEVEGGDYAD